MGRVSELSSMESRFSSLAYGNCIESVNNFLALCTVHVA